MKSFKDKVAAITGAGSGMGRALAVGLAQRGCHLALSDVDEASLAETADLAKAHGVQVTHQMVDVADRGAVEAWAARVVEDHGRVNLIFNNAGVALSSTIDAVDYADFEWIVNINFWGVVYGTKAFLPYLEASGEGHVVNTSSLFGLVAQPFMSTYNATKFAVRGFTESLRQELELQDSCVSATSVHPGGIQTNIAKAARQDPSVSAVTGQDDETARRNFEKFFITSSDEAAEVILRGVMKNRRRVLIGRDARAMDLLVRLMPSLYQRFAVKVARRFLLREQAEVRPALEAETTEP